MEAKILSQLSGLLHAVNLSSHPPSSPPDAGMSVDKTQTRVDILCSERRSTTEHFNTQPTDNLDFALLFVY